MNSILSLIRQAAEARYEKANVPAYCKLIAEAEKGNCILDATNKTG